MSTKRFIARNGLDNNNQTITNVANPSANTDVTTKGYTESTYRDAANITSGTLVISRGGTNQTSFTTGPLIYFDGTRLSSLANVSVRGTYGNSTHTTTISTDNYGRITSISNTAIAIATTSVSGLVKLNDTFLSTSTTEAATANTVKFLYDNLTNTANSSTNASNIITGTLSNDRLVSVPNRALQNSAITINGSSIHLASSITNLAVNTGKLSQFATTTAAELAGIIADYTGTGALVFANNTVLGSYTTISGRSGAATLLIQESSNSLLRLISTSNSNYIQSGISSTGSSRDLIFTNINAANEWMRLSSLGNLGIGTNAPSEKLHISGNQIIESNSSNTALRITQTGGGNALVVEDSANPDSTPVVIDQNGNVLIGRTAQITGAQYNPSLQIFGSDASLSGVGQFHYSNDSIAAKYQLNKTRATTSGGHVIVQNGDQLGTIQYSGSDGINYIRSSSIIAEVDGTPGVDDMPGRLIFSTTADNTSTPTERLRIDSSGRIGIATGAISGGVRLNVGGNWVDSAGYSVQCTLQGTITSSTINEATGYYTNFGTQASSFVLSNLFHYRTAAPSIGSGSSISNQFGFYVPSSLTGATNNYGFHSNISANTGRYNFYAAGTADNYFAGSVGVGATALTGYKFRVGDVVTGATSGWAVASIATGQSDVTVNYGAYYSLPSTAAAAYTLSNLYHYNATQGTIGATSSVTNQYGFFVNSNLTGANNNYGFFSAIPSGTGDWNFYASGTASNYFAGAVGIGATSLAGFNLYSNRALTGATTASSFQTSGAVQSDVTAEARSYSSYLQTSGATFSLGAATHYYAQQGSFTSATVTNQYGFRVDSNLIGATNNYGFYSAIPSGTGDYNFYAAGTADNYFGGPVTINSSLTVTGNVTFSGNVTTVSANNLSIRDNMIYLNSESNVSNPDLGFTGKYNDGISRNAGFFRDASDGYWKVFDQYLPNPDASPFIDTSNSSFRIADFQANNATFGKITTSSNALVTNLNADLLDGQSGSYYNTAGNLTGTIPASVLTNSTLYVGTTAVTLNRASAALALTGITSIDGTANVSSFQTVTNAAGTGIYTLQMVSTVSGNLRSYSNTGLNFNAATGALSGAAFNSTGPSPANFTDSVNGTSANKIVNIMNGSTWIGLQSNSSAGAYNGITSAGDAALWYSTGNSNSPGNLVIAPWSVTSFGMRLISSSNTVAVTGSLTTTANTGIGTSSPSTWGRLAVVDSSSGGQVVAAIVNTSGTANTQSVLSFDTTNNGFNVRDSQIRATNNGSNQTTLEFYTSSAAVPTEKMRITNDGNVGIGTRSPGYKLDVSGTANTGTLTVNGIQTINNPGNQLHLFSGSANTIIHRYDGSNYYILLSNAGSSANGNWNNLRPFQISNAGAVSIDVTGVGTTIGGNLGIGISSPAYKLDVSGTANTGALSVNSISIRGNVSTIGSNTLYSNCSIVPTTDVTYTLGSPTNRWNHIYTGDLHLSNESKKEGNEIDGTTGNWTLQEGADCLFIINNKSGKKYKFVLEEI